MKDIRRPRDILLPLPRTRADWLVFTVNVVSACFVVAVDSLIAGRSVYAVSAALASLAVVVWMRARSRNAIRAGGVIFTLGALLFLTNAPGALISLAIALLAAILLLVEIVAARGHVRRIGWPIALLLVLLVPFGSATGSFVRADTARAWQEAAFAMGTSGSLMLLMSALVVHRSIARRA